ncbi:hypothetical protein HPP92_023821 [Vanilla planifolia]|uniref:Chaperone DnaJ C-terminal domain-containing protein n=1 Tax=Vanilla planifolia TaxID=51239 RepID=A0A835PRK9_VANPL|nr:hypothetical protein HPP92_023821 [Vanilla planifolia]
MEDILMINMNAVLKNETKITYPKKEDDFIAVDIVFVVEEMPHEMFTRKGNDLITTQKISLAQALKGYKAHLKTLDDRTLAIPISSISSTIHPRYEMSFLSNQNIKKSVLPSNGPISKGLLLNKKTSHSISRLMLKNNDSK